MLRIKSTSFLFLEILQSLTGSKTHFIQDNNSPKTSIWKGGYRCVSSSLAPILALEKKKYQPHAYKPNLKAGV